jgi:hypothetical protein
VESFNGELRDECLCSELSLLLDQKTGADQNRLQPANYLEANVMTIARVSGALFFCLVLASCLLAAPGDGGPGGAGRILVVDSSHPRADDAGPGTEDRPWKTIGQAAKKAGPGDTVCVMEGTYAERVTIPASASGEPARKTIFRACPRHLVTVQGFELGGAGNVRIEGFHLIDSGVLGRWGDGVEVVDNRFEVKTYAVAPDFSNQPRKCLVAGNRMFKPQSGLQVCGYDWIIERNEVDSLKQWDKRDADYSRAFGEGHVFRRNYFHGARLDEIGTAHVDGCQTWHIKGRQDEFARKITFEDNIFLNIGQGIIARSVEEPGYLADFTCRRNIFGYGQITDKEAIGAWGFCLQGISGMTVENNLVLKTIHGLGLWGSGSAVVRNNIFYQTNSSAWSSGNEKTQTPFAGTFEAHYNLVSKLGSLDATNIVKDPMFVDVAAGNFRLKADSPCRHAGQGGGDIGPLSYPNVYCVDPGHPAADDAKFGYPAVPFKTAARGCAVAETGETIVLYGGIYREALTVKKDGLTIRATKGEKVVISGADLIVGWTRTEDGWAAPLANRPQKILRDGQPWTNFIYTDYSSRTATNKIILKTGGDPRLHVFETVVREHGLDLGGTKVRVEGLTITDTTGAPVTGAEKAELIEVTADGKPLGKTAPPVSGQ